MHLQQLFIELFGCSYIFIHPEAYDRLPGVSQSITLLFTLPLIRDGKATNWGIVGGGRQVGVSADLNHTQARFLDPERRPSLPRQVYYFGVLPWPIRPLPCHTRPK